MIRTIGLTTAIVFLTLATASAQVPKPEDIKSCNEKAKSEVETASASPRTDVATAGVGTPPINPKAPSPRPAENGKRPAKSVTVEERDPQLQGIDPEGAKDPAYVMAYKSCMRQAGF